MLQENSGHVLCLGRFFLVLILLKSTMHNFLSKPRCNKRKENGSLFFYYCVCNDMQLDFCYWLVKSDFIHNALKIHTTMHFLVDICQSVHPR